jgi:hypothetical protein
VCVRVLGVRLGGHAPQVPPALRLHPAPPRPGWPAGDADRLARGLARTQEGSVGRLAEVAHVAEEGHHRLLGGVLGVAERDRAADAADLGLQLGEQQRHGHGVPPRSSADQVPPDSLWLPLFEHPVRSVLPLVVGVPQAATGAWAMLAPCSWYTSFPGLGHTWLPAYGPFDEHLATDAGPGCPRWGCCCAGRRP